MTTINLAGPDAVATQNEPRPRSGWPDWAGYAAALWATTYGVAALIWTITGSGFPFGANDPGSGVSVLRNLSASVGAPVFAAVLLSTAVVALAMAGSSVARPARWLRVLALGSAWAVGLALLIMVPDTRVLAVMGYAPMLLIGLPFGWPDVDYSEIFTWPLFNQVFSLVGGFLVIAAAVAWQRRTASACGHCGRSKRGEGWATPQSAARWGRWAVGVAVGVPAVYAASRLAWAVNIPLFIDEEFLRELRAENGHLAGAGLAAFALVGMVLTLGLAQRWGEVFPRWMIGLRGKRVPVRLAVIPASFVAATVTSASVSLLSMPKTRELIAEGDPLVVPMILWPLWSLALAGATLAYYLRRRGTCVSCGRG